jgi:hypothetical protein
MFRSNSCLLLAEIKIKIISSETTNANDLHLGTNDAFAYSKDSSFHFDRVKNIATMGNSCFR